MSYRAAVITVSDRAFAGVYEDKSGPALCAMLREAGYEIARTAIVPDEQERIWNTLKTADNFKALLSWLERFDACVKAAPECLAPEFDDSGWKSAVQCNPPGGLIVKEDLEPCKVMREYEPVGEKFIFSYQTVYDFGTNLTGWCEIEVEGVRGETVKLEYAEQIRANGNITQEEIGMFIKKDGFQTDTYTLKGEGVERFRPRFTYHGFRYVRVICDAPVKPEDFTAVAHAGQFWARDKEEKNI